LERRGGHGVADLLRLGALVHFACLAWYGQGRATPLTQPFALSRKVYEDHCDQSYRGCGGVAVAMSAILVSESEMPVNVSALQDPQTKTPAGAGA
jgi:hypothetical protein